MKNITIPISTPKKILGRGTRIIPVQEELDTAEQPLSSLKGTASGSVGAHSRFISNPFYKGMTIGSGANDVTPKPNAMQQSDAELAAHLPLDFPIDAWDKMSTKAQLQAMKFSGLTAAEQWRLLNLPVPLADLVTAGRAKQEFIVAHAGGKVLPAREPNTETPKTAPLQLKKSGGELEERRINQPEKDAQTTNFDTSRQAVLRNKLLGNKGVIDNQKQRTQEELPIYVRFNLMHPNWPYKRVSNSSNTTFPNKKNIEMFNLGTKVQRELKKGEYYYVENAVSAGNLVEGIVILFDGTKYAKYRYTGLSTGKSISPVDQVWVKGYVNNIYSPADYEGSFFNTGLGIGPIGFSASIGYNKNTETAIVAGSEVAEQLAAGISLGYQEYYCLTDGWVYGEAPILWGNTPWDRDSMDPYWEA